MTHLLSARLHAWLVLSTASVAGRLRTAPQRGQGTVEYVALILLVAGVLAAAVTVASEGAGLEEIIIEQIKAAIGKVSAK